MSKNPISTWLQNYNARHFHEYEDCVRLEILSNGSGWLSFEDEVIPGTNFENTDELEYILLNQ